MTYHGFLYQMIEFIYLHLMISEFLLENQFVSKKKIKAIKLV